MTSITIYTPIKPTYLYIKQHSVTGLKYFGKTTKSNPYKYLGSGTHWIRHIKKHGKEFVKTIWLSEPYIDSSITEVALLISEHWDIVNSKEWANLMPENGLNGGANSPESIQKMLDTRKRNGTGMDNPDIIKKAKDTKKRNGTEHPMKNPESVQKSKDTKKERGIGNPMKNPESVQKMLDTKKRNGTQPPMKNPKTVKKSKDTKKINGTCQDNPKTIQKSKDTKKERVIINPSKIPFLSLIHNKKTYSKGKISHHFPELKQYY